MMPLVIAAAVLARAAFPPFGVEGVPGRYSDALPNLFMSTVNRGGCAETVGDTAIDGVTAGAIAGCGEDPGCVSDVSGGLVVDFVVLGSLRREGSIFRMKLDVVDASRRSMTKRLEKSFDSLLNGVPGAIGELGGALCKVLQTTKPAAPAAVLAQRRARKDPPAAAPQRPPADDLSLDLPLSPGADLDLPAVPPEPKAPPPAVAVAAPPPPAPLLVPLEPPPAARPAAPAPPPAVTPSPQAAPAEPATEPAPQVAPPVAVAAPPAVMEPQPPPVPGPSAGEVLSKLPWNWILVGAAAVSTGVGVYFGSNSQAIWGRDRVETVGGIAQHSISKVDAMEANKQATNANISFAVAGALAAGGGALFLVKF